MSAQDLEKNLRELGFPLLEVSAGADANWTLAEVVKSRDTRLWEGFPVLLANVLKGNQFHKKDVEVLLKDQTDKSALGDLVLASLALYKNRELATFWVNTLSLDLSGQEKARLSSLRESLRSKPDLTLSGLRLNSKRLNTLFENYLERESLEAKKTRAKFEEFSLEYSLSQVFSPRQKELFKKKLNRDAMTKTEREYFSRAVKKKVLALANPDLHRLAQKLLE